MEANIHNGSFAVRRSEGFSGRLFARGAAHSHGVLASCPGTLLLGSILCAFVELWSCELRVASCCVETLLRRSILPTSINVIYENVSRLQIYSGIASDPSLFYSPDLDTLLRYCMAWMQMRFDKDSRTRGDEPDRKTGTRLPGLASRSARSAHQTVRHVDWSIGFISRPRTRP